MNSEELAQKMRKHALNMTNQAHASHIGAILSVTDIIACLYAKIANINPANVEDTNRDRIILSKGHAGVAIYAALAEMGFFPVEELQTYYQNGSFLSGHVSHKHVPGVEISTGSLGHGIGVGCGMALSGKQDKLDYHVYVIIGDGECNEGSIWEAAAFAYQYKLSNLTVVVDHNKMQAMGSCQDVMDPIDMAQKWRSYGWNVVEVPDGNNHTQLHAAFLHTDKVRPTCVVAHTIKGKGVSFMENNLVWHYRDPQGDSYFRAVSEVEAFGL